MQGRISDLLAVVPELGSPLDYAVHDRDLNIVDMVNEALGKGRVSLVFQPVVRADGVGRPAFWEGLIRVEDRTGRVIPARDFITRVEADEVGRRLDCRALELGFDALAAEPSLRLAINMSARSIACMDWHAALEQGIARDATAAERLILEISERSAMLLPDAVRAFTDRMNLKGVCFVLDHFAAGATMLRHLRDFNFDMVKIDGQFVRGIADHPDNRALVGAILDIAHNFGMLTIAHSVESLEDADWLIGAGVDCLQGYYFSIPTADPWWCDTPQELTA